MSDDGIDSVTQAQINESLDKLVAIGQLVTNPRWSKIWFNMNHLCRPGEGVTAQEVIDNTDIPQSTVYDDLDDMVQAGCIKMLSDGRPRKYTPVSVQVFVSEHPGDIGEEYLFTSSIIGVVGETYDDENASLFLDRNSVTLLNELISLKLDVISEKGKNHSLVEYIDDSVWINKIDISLIEPAIARILEKHIENPDFDLEL